MKLIIEIPEDRYDEIHSLKFVMYGLQSEENRKLFYRLINAVQDGTPIPDNATNGDVIKAMFPNGITIDRSTAYAKQVTEDWWNAPYQRGNLDE